MKVIVGLSGGVDSSVSAWLLQQAGHEVEGLFMKNWEEDDTQDYCSAAADLADAQMVCDKLGIRLHVVNFALEYWENVFEKCLAAYRLGVTPNPDVLCNREIKFKAFLEYARNLGADCIATGHYAKNIRAEKWELHKAADLNKDQSYFLCALGQEQLAQAIFPLGDYQKPMVRKLAAELGLTNHDKKDSTGICFVGERKFKQFLQQYLPVQPGKIVSVEGLELGQHEGLMFYTIGQRQGLGIGGQAGQAEAAWYVVAKDLTQNTLLVAQGHDHPALFTKELLAVECSWVAGENISAELACTAKIRYRQQDQPCHLSLQADGQVKVSFEQPQRAVTPGQAIVFYAGSRCLGGGIIQKGLNYA